MVGMSSMRGGRDDFKDSESLPYGGPDFAKPQNLANLTVPRVSGGETQLRPSPGQTIPVWSLPKGSAELHATATAAEDIFSLTWWRGKMRGECKHPPLGIPPVF